MRKQSKDETKQLTPAVTLLRIVDDLSIAKSLTAAAFMAADSIGGPEGNALCAVIHNVEKQLEDIYARLDSFRLQQRKAA
jgi:hypothetical protein